MRWLGAVVAVLLLIGAGYLLFLNPDPVEVHLTPNRSTIWPLAGALLVAFAAGGALVGTIGAVRAGARGLRSWRAGRRARHHARRAESVARAHELVWAGDYRQARSELLRGESGVPADIERLALLAESHLNEGDVASARKVLEDGLLHVGLDARLLDLLADAAERGGDLRGAADALERARKIRPESPRLARRLRDVYSASGRWSEALSLQGEILLRLHDAATLAREEQVMRGLRYQAALAETEPRRAARLLLAVAREDPGFVPAWVSAGDLLVQAGRRFTARRVWERGARHRPSVVLLDRLERLNASEGKPERTARLYSRLRRRHGESATVPLMLVRHLIAQGRLDEAADALNTLPPAVSGHSLVHALWGEVHRRRGNHNLAADTYARALGGDTGAAGPFRCAVCRRPAEAWTGYCEGCRQWGTYEARMEVAEP
jgi:tetratricopeptide (TPR) repeat protein